MTVLLRATERLATRKNKMKCGKGCYDAKRKNCFQCPCGGVNHGIGEEKAIVNTWVMIAKGLPDDVVANKKVFGKPDEQKKNAEEFLKTHPTEESGKVKAEDLNPIQDEVQDPVVETVTVDSITLIVETEVEKPVESKQTPIEGIPTVLPRARVIRGPGGKFVKRQE